MTGMEPHNKATTIMITFTHIALFKTVLTKTPPPNKKNNQKKNISAWYILALKLMNSQMYVGDCGLFS